MNRLTFHLKMIIKFIFRDRHDLWVFLNMISRTISKILILILLVRFLPVDTIAAWYLFGAMFGIASLFEAGLGRVITRQVADRFNLTIDSDLSEPDRCFLASLLRLYLYVVLIVCALALFFGLLWLMYGANITGADDIILPWLVFVLANGVALFAGVYAAVANGFGEVALTQKYDTISQVIYVLLFGLLLFVFSGILVPTLALLFSLLIKYKLNRKLVLTMFPLLNKGSGGVSKRYLLGLLSRLKSEAGKWFFVLVSFQVLTSVFILLLSRYEDSSMVASFGLTFQAAMIIFSFSNTWLFPSFPKMSTLKKNEDLLELRHLFYAVFSRGMIVLCAGLLCLIILGPMILRLIGSSTELLAGDLLYISLLVFTVEYITLTQFGQLLLSQSRLQFVKYVVFGVSLATLTVFFLFFSGEKLYSIMMARGYIFAVVVTVPVLFCIKKILWIRDVDSKNKRVI